MGTRLFGAWAEPREVTLALERSSDVRALDVRWTPEQLSESEGHTHVSQWNFGPEGAPNRLHATVPLKDGPYDVEIHVERTTGPRDTHRRVLVEGSDHISIPVD